MKTPQQQLVEQHQRITRRGGKISTVKGSLERQLCESAAEITRLCENEKSVTESRRTATQVVYESMGLLPEQSKIAANPERSVQTPGALIFGEVGSL